jgi:hypothetical protein
MFKSNGYGSQTWEPDDVDDFELPEGITEETIDDFPDIND